MLNAKNGREIVRIPLGDTAAQRYGAPYWIIHRGDLQAVLSAAVSQDIDIALKLGMRMEDFATHPRGVTVSARGAQRRLERTGRCADRRRRPVVDGARALRLRRAAALCRARRLACTGAGGRRALRNSASP